MRVIRRVPTLRILRRVWTVGQKGSAEFLSSYNGAHARSVGGVVVE